MDEHNMPGIIGFDNLRIACIIGVKPEERVKEQEIFIDMKIEADVSKCVASDEVEDTVDYVTLSNICADLARRGKFRLLEAFANAVLEKVMRDYDVTWAWIRVKKPMALHWAKHTSIELSRGKKCVV